jgi:MFS family permease
LIINAAISIIAPFYPTEAAKRGMTQDIVGFVFAALPLGGFFFSLIFGKYMRYWGRKKLLFIGMILLIIGFILFAVIDYTQDLTIFLTISIIGRMIQGLGLSAFTSVSYAYLPLLYKAEELHEKIGYMEASLGIGMLIAPLFGSLLYYLWGYQAPFYVMTGVILIFSPWLIRSLPADTITLITDKRPLSLRKVLSRRKILFTYGFSAFVMMGFAFLDPVFANHLLTFGLNIVEIGVVFSVGTLSYSACMIVIGKYSHNLKRSYLMVLGCVFYIISFLLLGPQSIIGLPKNIWIVSVGMVVLGLGATLTVLPVIPEFISLCGEVYKNEEEGVGDLSSGMFDSSYLVGSLIGPIMSGYLTEAVGFEDSSSIFALILAGYMVVYCLFGGILEELLEKEKQEDTLLPKNVEIHEEKNLI